MAIPEDEERERVYKVLLVGNGRVGKTSFVERYVNNRFSARYKDTIGVDFAVKVLHRNEDTIKLQLWDIQGQERAAHFTRVYYKGAAGCIIMFDLTDRQSFEDVQKWKVDLDSKVRNRGKKLPCLLLANKSDLGDRCVNLDEINAMSKDNGFSNWIAISVKENKLVSQSMNRLVDILIAEDVGNDVEERSDNECDGSLLELKQEKKKTKSNGQTSLQGCCV
ncbi:ras-related protein Rab-7L1-like [Corticium candelabrum]|uniref:ras-related protein Rab-7L1-like n=1 Tax=Corticium candelabrum TaxID=121492 RepID=UPI002E26ABCA|nr:ras-related protein Rab-7L1-like [Corticium candelabrum]XP_062523072.1 ras-related protein Rab-7L1-like [Corticium candelabrum]